MKVNVNKPDLLSLNADELRKINGGTSDSSASITMSSGVDSLLSLDFKWQQGDNYKEYKIEAGKNIDVNLNAFGAGSNM